MNLFQEMEVNYKDFIESANDFMDSCREYTNDNEDEKIYIQFGEIAEKKRWKDKIKAKIEELDDLNSPFAQRVIKGKEVYLTEMVQNILQSLLEKE